ncbi:MAG: nuclear transport factor 2 family protein [Desulfomonile tiedjei]|nr:nuclear transport factor 2 family protein [Desulfomonile tiedjei]
MRNTILVILLIAMMGLVEGFAAEDKQGAGKVLPADQTQSAQTVDEKAVRASAEAFVDAFNKGDAKRISALWTTDCEYVNEAGRVIQGREAMEKEYTTFFSANPGLKMENTVSSAKILGGKAAVEEGTSVLKNADGGLISKGHYKALLLKEGDRWLISSVREYASPLLSVRPDFADLDWLIGDWTAEKGTKNLDFTFRWVADKRFIELSYVARDKDVVARSGIQIIGRDPASGEVASWSFDSSGGYGRGMWKLLKNGWIVESQGVMPDGSSTTSTDIVSKMDGERFTWQSVNRRVAGRGLTDSEVLVLKRKSK